MTGLAGADVAGERLLPIERPVVGTEVGADGEIDDDGLLHRVGAVEQECDPAQQLVVSDRITSGVGDSRHEKAGLGGDSAVQRVLPRGASSNQGAMADFVFRQTLGHSGGEKSVDVRLGPNGAESKISVGVGRPVLLLEVRVLPDRAGGEVEQPLNPRPAAGVVETRMGEVDAGVGKPDENVFALVAGGVRRRGSDEARGGVEQQMQRRRHFDRQLGMSLCERRDRRGRAPDAGDARRHFSESEGSPGDAARQPDQPAQGR